MNRQETIKEIRSMSRRLGGMWSVLINDYTRVDYVMGYYLNEETGLYEVYVNHERGMQHIRLRTPSEDEAIEKLHSIVSINAGIHEKTC